MLEHDGAFSKVELSAHMMGALVNQRLLSPERSKTTMSNVMRRNAVGRYFADYVLKQDISHVSERHIDAFIDPRPTTDYQRLGRQLVLEAVKVAVEPIAPVYAEARQAGQVSMSAPVDLDDVVTAYFAPRHYPDYFPALEKQLAA